jgi:glycosyltransferase involved in cell wall biosynthesis
MSNSMNFSVLLSVYYKESPEYLSLALDSVFGQTLQSDDVVLVEDGALTEPLEDVVKSYEQKHPELHVVRYEKNRGLGAALNDGLLHCKHEIIARMDTDDIAKPERFEKQIKVMSLHPEYDLVGSWIDEFVDDVNHVTSVRKVPEAPKENYQYCKTRCPVNHPTVVYRKKAVLEADGYLTKYFPEDYFLWIRMLMNGSKFYNIQESLLYFRYSPDTFKRRGGWKYACDEVHVQTQIYRMGFINFTTYLRNVIIRFSTRMLPNSMREWIYRLFLRN